MEIKTKFNPGERVWCIRTYYEEIKLTNEPVEKIAIKIDSYGINSIRYTIFGQEFDESCVFATKEELKNYFFKD